jgi:hypothetical protein
MVEQLICNQQVGGSIPFASSDEQRDIKGITERSEVIPFASSDEQRDIKGITERSEVIPFASSDNDIAGQVAKRSNATDCKSVGLRPSEVQILPCPLR